MNSVVAIHMKKINDEKVIVDLFQGKIAKEFSNIEEATSFAKEHCIGLLKTNETSAVSIWYEREDDRASYIIFERLIEEDKFEYIEYEETAYDYVISHDQFFKGHLTRRMINERYYSFHDFARVSTLTSSFVAAMRMGISALTMIMSIIFLLYGLHAVNMSSVKDDFIHSDKVILNIYIIIGSLLMAIVGTLALVSYALPIYKLQKSNWNYDEIDWRKLNSLRNKLKMGAIALMTIGVGLMIHFLYVYLNSPLWNAWDLNNEGMPFFVITMISSGSFVLIGLMAGLNSINNIRYNKRNIHKYFTPEEIKKYFEWLDFKSNDVIYKTDYDYFLTPFDDSHDVVLNKLMLIQEVVRTSTKEEIKIFKEKAYEHYKIAVDSYMKQLKESKGA